MRNKNNALIFLTLILTFLIILPFSVHGQNDAQHYIVFSRGEGNHHTYRIPSIIQARNGALIAFVEARRDHAGDPGRGHIDLIYKTSKDGGRSWSAISFLEKSQEGWGASNPTAVVTSKGRIVVFYNVWKPGKGSHPSNYSQPGTLDNQLWLRYSDDNGKTWSDARNITKEGRDIDRWGNAVFGPGRGIETKSGRLVIPVNSPGAFADDSLKTASFALYSDDGGKNWQRGQHINAYTTENQIVELDDGRLMIDARQKEDRFTRWVAFSNDQGTTWSEPKPGQVCAQICTGIIKYPLSGGQSLLLWSGIKGPGRSNLVLRISNDQGNSFPVELLIGPGPTAYSTMTLLDKDHVGILWEGGKESPYENVIFTRVPKQIIMNMYHLSTVNRNVRQYH